MNTTRRHVLHAGATAALGLALPGLARAADDLKNARITVGFPAGDMADSLARVVADFIKGKYAENVLVDNKPGAAARIAIGSFVGTKADPSEVLFTPGAMIVLFPHVFQKLQYDPLKDLEPVTKIANASFGLGVGPAVPAEIKTLEQYLAWAKKDAKNANYATSGAGTGIHLTGEYLAKLTGTPLSMVPYKGGAPAVADLVAGQIPAQMATIPSLIEHVRGGRVRILAVSSAERVRALPDVPTFKDLGLSQLVTDDWFGFFVRPGTPAAAIEALNRSILGALKEEKVLAQLDRMVLTVNPTATPAEFKALVEGDYRKWAQIAKTVDFNPMS